MRLSKRQTRLRRALPLVLLVTLAVGVAVGYVARSGHGQRQVVQLATGSTGGVLHPIAGEFRPDSTTVSECKNDTRCLQQALGNVAFENGPKAALAMFQELVSTSTAVHAVCHPIAHTIGSAALARFEGDVAKTFSLGAPTCVSGYYHGILERAFLGITSEARLVEAARSVCVGSGLRRWGFLDYQCRHGLGHGLMIQTGYDLPLALTICARLGTGWDRVACSSGVFMENSDTRFGFRSRWLDDEDPIQPCPRMRIRDRHSCYLRASWRILTSVRGDFVRAGERCARLGVWARTCYRGLGRDAVDKGRGERARIAGLCAQTAAGRGDCLLGVARTIANASGAAGVRPAAAFCRSVSASDRDACFSGLGVVIGMLQPTDAARSAACTRFAPRHRDACLRAAIAEVYPTGARSWG